MLPSHYKSILDIRLAALAQSYSCTYSRYADDLTFSTRKNLFPPQIMKEDSGVYTPSKKLKNEIRRAGFELNEKKTRIQYKDSRQDVTGLVVNTKPNIKYEYWRTVKSKCHSLFKKGFFTKKLGSENIEGHISELEGQLNFIDQVDYFNRIRKPPPLGNKLAISTNGNNTKKDLTGRETTFSRFLYYRYFYGNEKPTILCEGKTDNIYLKLAINKLALKYPRLATPKSATSPYKPLVKFIKHTKRTDFLLKLSGGAEPLKSFIISFEGKSKFYTAPRPNHPVIIVLDNDSGFNSIDAFLKKNPTIKYSPDTLTKDELRKTEFIHVTKNLYIVLITQGENASEAAIESLFPKKIFQRKLNEKSFNPDDKKMNKEKEFSKAIFATKVVLANKNDIDFSGFNELLTRITKCIEHYDQIKTAK